ncbi:hypothetical protein GCM10020295_69440 [Streptomyces cinereospinus]
MTNLSGPEAAPGGKVDSTEGEHGGGVHCTHDPQREAMTAQSATAARVRTGGPSDNGPKIVEHVMGWVLVVVLAMLVTQLGLL